jgi:hypothetical protein
MLGRAAAAVAAFLDGHCGARVTGMAVHDDDYFIARGAVAKLTPKRLHQIVTA